MLVAMHVRMHTYNLVLEKLSMHVQLPTTQSYSLQKEFRVNFKVPGNLFVLCIMVQWPE